MFSSGFVWFCLRGEGKKRITFLISHMNKTDYFNSRYSGTFMSEHIYQNNCIICLFAIIT